MGHIVNYCERENDFFMRFEIVREFWNNKIKNEGRTFTSVGIILTTCHCVLKHDIRPIKNKHLDYGPIMK